MFSDEIKEDVEKMVSSSNTQFNDLTNLICELFPKTREYSKKNSKSSISLLENFCQNNMGKKDFESQIENEVSNFIILFFIII